MLDYTTYRKKVEELAFYPYAGEKNVASLIYPVLGLNGEVTELLEKVGAETDYGNAHEMKRKHIEPILYEMGDVLWYITRVADELDTSLENVVGSIPVENISYNEQKFAVNARKMVIACGRIAEITKKTLRDDNGDITADISSERRKLILEALREVVQYFIILSENFKTNMDEIAEMNVQKLESRKNRGTLSGSGDNR